MNRKDVVRAGYDAVADAYFEARTKDPAGSEDVRLLEDLRLRLPAGATVLDAGCGAGVPVTRILSESFEVTGVDFSDAQLERARRLVPQARFLRADLTSLDLPDRSFDGIVSYYAVIHIPREEHPRVLRNFHRMLKPSGVLLACLGEDDEPGHVDDYYGTPMFWSHYDRETNLRMLRECVFSTVWAKTVVDPIWPGATHLFALGERA